MSVKFTYEDWLAALKANVGDNLEDCSEDMLRWLYGSPFNAWTYITEARKIQIR
jgi:hypothetical protein